MIIDTFTEPVFAIFYVREKCTNPVDIDRTGLACMGTTVCYARSLWKNFGDTLGNPIRVSVNSAALGVIMYSACALRRHQLISYYQLMIFPGIPRRRF